MQDLFDIQHDDGRLILNLKRPAEVTDFKIVSEVNNSIRFICDDEDNWEFLEVDHETKKGKKIWMATLKLRYFYADQLREEIEKIVKEENISINSLQNFKLAGLYKVHKIHLYSENLKEESKTSLRKVGESKEESAKEYLVEKFTKDINDFNFISLMKEI